MRHDITHTCWNCGTRHALASNLDAGIHMAPQDGDVTLCGNCAALSIFKNGEPVEPSDHERVSIFQEMPSLVDAQRMIKEYSR